MKIPVHFAINNLNTAGMKYVLASIASGIDKNLFDPCVIVYRKSGSDLEKKLGELMPILELNFRSSGTGHFFSSFKKNVLELKKTKGVLHSFDYTSDFNEVVSAKLARIPYIAEKTNMNMHSYRWKIKLGLADHIVCLSTAQAKQLNKYNRKLTLIPTGVDIASFSNAEPALRSEFNIAEDDVLLICVAHLVPVKGHEELISSIAQVKDEFPLLKIICIGEGDSTYVSNLTQLAKSSGVEDKIIFKGSSNKVASLMKMADGKILTTRNVGRKEAFGAVLVEAMACGLPVISTRSGGPEDIVIDEVTGYLIDAHGVTPIVEGIRKFMHNRDSWRSFGDAGFKRAKMVYDEQSMIKSYESVYMNVYNKHYCSNG